MEDLMNELGRMIMMIKWIVLFVILAVSAVPVTHLIVSMIHNARACRTHIKQPQRGRRSC